MMKHFLRRYSGNTQFEADYNGANYEEPWVSVTDGDASGRVNYNKTEREKMRGTPLTFEILSDGVINWGDYLPDEDGELYVTIEYSKDFGETWTEVTITSVSSPEEIQVQRGDTVMFRGDNDTYYDSETLPVYACFIGTTCRFNVKGNIMSLINSTNFPTLTSFPDETYENFGYLFYNCTGLTDASMLILPATTLSSGCYGGMFAGCTSLTTVPELTATALTERCYSFMFSGCESLTTAPSLPATTLTGGCYSSMFAGCTSLTTAPSLPATTLARSCYNSMFAGCTSLTAAPELPVTTLADYCYGNMFAGCTSLTTAPELPATTLTSACYSAMFSGCTSLTTTPELPATTIAFTCYENMFDGCTSLTNAPSVLPATTLGYQCYAAMFAGCTSLTAAPELPATTLTEGCYMMMFQNCTSLTTAPELPANTLTNYCYRLMFDGCSNLSYIKCLATNKSATNCTEKWVNGVASSGTFVKNANMSSWPTGVNGIPSGWTVETT